MNTTLHPFKRRDIPDVLSRALKRAHDGIPETLTGRAFSKVKVWFIDRYRFQGAVDFRDQTGATYCCYVTQADRGGKHP